MAKVKEIADRVDESLKVTTDCKENYDSKKVPVLDLNVWIGRGVSGEVKVLHSHYMKPVASRATIHWRSSHSEEMKRNVAVNELMRINRNCSRDLPWEDVTEHMSYYIKRLQYSGYPEEFRQEVVNNALARIDKSTRITRAMSDNVPPITPVDRQQWYTRSGRFDSVMFVEATPSSELARRIRDAVKRSKLRIQVVEKAGTTIKGLLQRSNPYGVGPCHRSNCLICERGGAVDCRVRGCVYEYLCEECGRKYRGQTGRTIQERDYEHMASWEAGDDECPLQRHSNIYHGGERYGFDLRVIAKCYGKPTKRMITEAVQIGELTGDQTMNNKSEWNYTNLAKVNVSR